MTQKRLADDTIWSCAFTQSKRRANRIGLSTKSPQLYFSHSKTELILYTASDFKPLLHQNVVKEIWKRIYDNAVLAT